MRQPWSWAFHTEVVRMAFVGRVGGRRWGDKRKGILLLPHPTRVHVSSCEEPGQPFGAANITTCTLIMEGATENGREIWALDLSVAYETRNNSVSDYMRFLSLSDFQHCRLWCLAWASGFVSPRLLFAQVVLPPSPLLVIMLVLFLYLKDTPNILLGCPQTPSSAWLVLVFSTPFCHVLSNAKWQRSSGQGHSSNEI